MSTEFRQRKAAEYGQILWRRKWMILLPAIAISFAIAIVVWRLPNVYQSTTLLTVRPSSLTEGIVPQLSEDELTIRINNIAQEVFSRSSLEPLITNYNLYAAERKRGEPMELLVEEMKKKDIQIDLNKSRNDITNGFQLSFKGPDPFVAQRIASDLASKYTSAQAKVASESAFQTQTFITQQVEAAQKELDAIDKQRLEYLQANLSNLPTSTTALVQQLSGLYEQQKSLIAEIGRMRDQQTMLTTQLGAAEKNVQTGIEDVSESLTDPKTTLAWAELVKQESANETEIQSMLANGLRPKHPDVVAKRQELAAVQKQKQQMLDDWKEKIEEKKSRMVKRIDPSITTYKTQLQFAQGEIARQQKMLDETRSQIVDLEARINRVPQAEVGLGTIDREYATKKAGYDALLEKKQRADLAAQASKAAQGESIQVIDPASLPEKPVAPKRPLLMLLGLALGLFVGLLFAAVFEVPRLLTIQTVEDARHYTSLPVLVSVPELLTPREERRRKLRRATLAFASITATVLSVPALALLLKLSHVFEKIGT
ncbi:MAG: protein tyrosine kinase modulator [Acidobacteriota bacterium]|jgi:polysaccharide chain length determinant protein (PEP-CTERM system associated)|nr:protein tyrosine kinase modulator [Acidobacteriota bacterium]